MTSGRWKLFSQDESRDNFSGFTAGSCCRDSGGTAWNWRRHRASAGDGAPSAHGPAPGAGNFAFYSSAAYRPWSTAAILESRKRGFARRNFVRSGDDPGSVHRRKDCGADVDATSKGTIRRISDVFGSAAVDEGAALATCRGAGGSNRGRPSMSRQMVVDV